MYVEAQYLQTDSYRLNEKEKTAIEQHMKTDNDKKDQNTSLRGMRE
jgi:hypothetical protein